MTLPQIDLTDKDIIDVGQEHIVRLMYTDDTETKIASMVLIHPHKQNPDVTCQGFAEVGPGEWEIVERDPITIWPSFVCDDCKDHGIVMQGKWQAAQFQTQQHKIPVWLHHAMRAFCSSKEAIEHAYHRPIPSYGYASAMELELHQEWAALIRWLESETTNFQQ